MPASSRHLLVVRHGQSTWNADGRWQGQADPPLSTRGEAQARQACSCLAELGLTGVIASDLVRARHTAEIMAAALGMGEVVVDPGLREFDAGEWSGLTRPEIEQRWPGMLDRWSDGRCDCPPGGESRARFRDRVMSTVTRLAATAAGDRLLLVTHGGFIRTLDHLLGLAPTHIPNLAGRWVQVDADGGLAPGTFSSLADPEHRAWPSR